MRSARAPVTLTPSDSPADRLLPISPAGIYGFLALAAIAGLSLWFLHLGWGRLAFVPAFLAFFVVLFRFRFGGLLVFVVGLAMVYLSDVFLARRGGDAVVFPALMLLTFLLTFYRMLTLAHQAFPRPERPGRPWPRVRRVGTMVNPAPPRRAPGAVSPVEPWTVPIWVVGLLVAALLVHSMLPEFGAGPELEDYEFDPRVVRIVGSIWIAALGLMGVSAFLAHVAWRQLTPLEAGTYLRGVIARWCGRPLEAMERYAGRRHPVGSETRPRA